MRSLNYSRSSLKHKYARSHSYDKYCLLVFILLAYTYQIEACLVSVSHRDVDEIFSLPNYHVKKSDNYRLMFRDDLPVDGSRSPKLLDPPSAWNNWAPTGRIFMKFDILAFF